jgi:hypothetical protein
VVGNEWGADGHQDDKEDENHSANRKLVLPEPAPEEFGGTAPDDRLLTLGGRFSGVG